VPNVFLFVSTLYRNTGKDEAALKILQDARVDYPREQSLIIEELNIYLTNKDFERAKTNLELAAEQDPTNEILWFSLGSVLDNIGMTEDAIVAYKKAIDVNSDYFDANYNLGALYFNKAVNGINEANEMWKPRMSRTEASEQKKLEEDSKAMFVTAKPFLESAFAADNKDVETIRSLKDIYARTGEDDKFIEMNNLLKSFQ
jgi:tetratricopeptide (TPR) repeat protein